jgi:hypothetical protein
LIGAEEEMLLETAGDQKVQLVPEEERKHIKFSIKFNKSEITQCKQHLFPSPSSAAKARPPLSVQLEQHSSLPSFSGETPSPASASSSRREFPLIIGFELQLIYSRSSSDSYSR